MRERASTFKYSTAVADLSAEFGIARLVGPGDKGGKSSGLILDIPEPDQMLDDLLVCLQAAEHHGRGRGHAEFLGGSHDLCPLPPPDLVRTHFFSDPVNEDLGAPAGNRIQAGGFETFKRIQNADSRLLCNEMISRQGKVNGSG